MKKPMPATAHDDAGGRSNGAAPQLLAQLPGSLFNSPGFIMGIVAFEILYGLFLFAVMSSSRKDRAAADLYAEAPATQPPRVALAEPAEPPKPEPSKPEPTKD